MTDCLFCKMAHSNASPKIYEDTQLFVIRDIHPKAEVHLLVIPKLHIPSLAEVQEEHAPLLGYVASSLKNFAKEQGLSSFRTVINTGAQSGQSIFHLHFHLIGGAHLSAFG